MNKFYLLLSFLLVIGFSSSQAQTGVLNPNDTVEDYNAAAPPITPNWGVLSKWVRTPRVNWNTSSYKCYFYNGMQFRLKFPKSYQHGVADGKKYPMIIFWHGVGERGTIYDNEYQLYHGGELHKNAVDNGTFDGFLLYPQNQGGFFGNVQYDAIKDLIVNYMIPEVKLDPYRIMVQGLSGGGGSSWDFMIRYPKLVAASAPISAVTYAIKDFIPIFKWIPVWEFQGGADTNPHPSVAQDVYATAQAAGANMKLTIYAGLGHGVWYNAWGEADYFPFAKRAHKANPWPLFGRTEFCPGDPINATLGVTEGFDQYEWRKDGNLIAGATSNTLVVTSIGVYDVRLRNGADWTPWSPIPVQIKIKAPTVSSNITVDGLMSKVIPAPDGSDSVTLQVPAGYTSYLWKKVTDPTTLGTQRTLTVKDSGLYVVKVTEQFGCSSEFSAPFKVVKASGANAPDPATNAKATPVSKTEMTVEWSENPNPANNETGFEIYRGTTAGGPYKMIALVGANVLTYANTGLDPNHTYFYIIRAVNENGAAAVSNEATGTTQVDNTPPTAPGNLTVTGTTRTSVGLTWTPSTDDVGVTKYDIYVNGVKSYTVDDTQTSFSVNNLTFNQVYTLTVKARDLTGNVSTPSNQVTAMTVSSGLNYKYYTGAFTVLPNFNALVPVKTGVTPTADISVRTQDDNFAFLWEGYINIPVTGNYTFETYSDDGSKLYIDNGYDFAGTALVDNDGLHGGQYKEGTIFLTAGAHRFAATFFEAGGGQEMKIYWKNTANGVTSRQEIPASFFRDQANLGGTAPAAPSAIKATAVSYNKINVIWTDNSNDETGFEVYRATSLSGPFDIIATTAANKVAYADSGSLQPLTTYYYKVKAINKYGNSGFNLADAGGLQYDYYEMSSISALPNFNNLTPVKSGSVSNVTLDIRNRDVNFAVKFAGYINLPTTGTYTFYTASDDGSKLYIDGFASGNQVVNNDFLQGTTERSGTKSLSAGRHAIYITYFQSGGGYAMSASYKGPTGSGIAKQLIPNAALENPNMKATTLALPAIPAAPTVLATTAVFSDKISLQWNDNSTTETAFEVYRSVNNNTNYKLQATIPANATATATYTDTALFANVTYYYKVRAKNVGGNSAYSNEINAQTLNSVPVLNDLPNRFMHYDTQLSVNVSAVDPDGEPVTLTVTNLPAFGSFTDNGNGTGTILFNNPSAAAQATYPDITVKATDQHSGVATKVFQLVVNANYAPILGTVPTTTINEHTSSQINIAVTNDNGTDALTWTYTGLPAFATQVSAGKNSQITLNPGYTDAGTYPVTVKVSDGVGGEDTKSFNIVINDVNPGFSVYVNFNDLNNDAPAPWNNTHKVPVAQNDVFGNLKDNNGNNTGYAIRIMTPWQTINGGSNANNLGVRTGNNSGVYPDNVMASSYFTTTVKQTFKVTGLSASYKYNFSFTGSRGGVTDNRTANYTINGTTVSLNGTGNSANKVTINNVSADANGEVSVDLQGAPGAVYAHINAMVIEAKYDDGTAPAKPRNFAARNIPTGIRLSWTDAAYNETAYEVYKSTDSLGTYQLLSPGGNENDTAYTDNAVVANTKYFYAIRAINTYGNSPFSDTVAIVAANRAPVMNTLSNVSMKTDDVLSIPITATDDPGDILTISATGLPAFATLNNTGNGAANIALAPTSSYIGTFNVTVTAADNHGGTSSQSFVISVRDKNMVSIYVNCNQTSPEGAPWNNFNGLPIANRNITNMLDETGAASGVTITLIDALTGANNVGAVTGNNSGIYPDNVMSTLYYDQTNTAKRIRVTGLSAARKYNLVFFGSRADVSDNRNTVYTVGAQSVTLNAAGNTSKTVQLNGLTPDANGAIEFTIKQATGSAFAYLNALVIQSYVDNGLPLSPANLTAVGKSRSSIQLDWSNKASNATGVEIYRSTAVDGTYSLVTTVGATVATYLDNNLSESTRYYYKLRAKANTVFSEYGNIASGATFSYSVKININVTSPEPAPWNNTNSLPFTGQTLSNIKDETNGNTSMVMTIDQNFTGTNPNGVVTGNNSGIYPDNVMAASYYVDKGDTAKVTFSGLNQSMAYSFVFFASRIGGGDRVSAYTINGKTVTLNAKDNISQTVQLDNIVPDQDGEIHLSVYVAPNGQYAYLNALVINASPKEDNPGGSGLLIGADNNRTGAGSLISSNNMVVTDPTSKAVAEEITIENVYPNPVTSFVNLLVKNEGKAKDVVIKVFDLSGKMIFVKAGVQLPSGTQLIRVDFNTSVPPGAYLLQMLTSENKRVKTVKLIKN